MGLKAVSAKQNSVTSVPLPGKDVAVTYSPTQSSSQRPTAVSIVSTLLVLQQTDRFQQMQMGGTCHAQPECNIFSTP